MEISFNGIPFTTGRFIKASGLLFDKLKGFTWCQYHSEVPLTCGKSKRTEYDDRTLLENVGIINLVKPSTYDRDNPENSTPDYYWVDKHMLSILFPLVCILNSLDSKTIRNCRNNFGDINLDLIFQMIDKAILKDGPLPFYQKGDMKSQRGRKENEFYNSLFVLFFLGLASYFEDNHSIFDECYFWNNLPLFRYMIKHRDEIWGMIETTYKFYANISFVSLLSPYNVCKFWVNIPEVLLNNKPRFLNKNDENEIRIDSEIATKLKEPDVPDYIKDEVKRSFNPWKLHPVEFYSDDSIRYIEESRDEVANYIMWYAYHNSHIIWLLCYLRSEIKKLNYDVSVRFKFVFEKEEEGFSYCYKVKMSTRQTSSFTKENKDIRKVLLKNYWGKCDSFDIHSSDFSLVRLFNTGKFETDWSLKQKIVDIGLLKYTGGKAIKLEEDDLSQLLHRLFNHTVGSYVDLYKQARNSEVSKWRDNKFHKIKIPKISTLSLNMIINKIKEECGDWHKYRYSLFFLESIVELQVVCEMLRKGLPIEINNDDFYFTIRKKDFLKLLKITYLTIRSNIVDAYPQMIPQKTRFNKGIISDDDKGIALDYLLYNILHNRKDDTIYFSTEYTIKILNEEGIEESSKLNKSYISSIKRLLRENAVVHLSFDSEQMKYRYKLNPFSLEFFINNCYEERNIDVEKYLYITEKIHSIYPFLFRDLFAETVPPYDCYDNMIQTNCF